MSIWKVLIIDDHTLVRQGLRLILESVPDISVIGEGSSGDDAILLTERYHPNTILMDVHMPPGLDGITATRHIRAAYPDVRIIMLTMFDDDAHVEKMLASGVSGILFKHDESHEIIEAIRTGNPNHPYLPKRLSRETRNRLQHLSRDLEQHVLSPRETEVLVYLASGYTNKEISNKLHISVKTVETHRANIMKRLELESRSDLVNYALKNRYIESLPQEAMLDPPKPLS